MRTRSGQDAGTRGATGQQLSGLAPPLELGMLPVDPVTPPPPTGLVPTLPCVSTGRRPHKLRQKPSEAAFPYPGHYAEAWGEGEQGDPGHSHPALTYARSTPSAAGGVPSAA